MKKIALLLCILSMSLHAQTTASSVKSQIDTDITNKVGLVSKANIGTNMKAVVDYIVQENNLKAPKLSPDFGGIPRVPTAASGTNTTQIASTAFVTTAVSAAVSSVTAQPLYYSVKVYQAGTGDPVPQSPQINTIEVGNYTSGSNFRDVRFTRVGAGQYYCEIAYESVATSPNKCALMISGYPRAEITAQASGSTGGYSYTRWGVNMYDTTWTLADNELFGNNGGYFLVVIYP